MSESVSTDEHRKRDRSGCADRNRRRRGNRPPAPLCRRHRVWRLRSRTERAELTEELVSGLWERWRAEVDAGATPTMAADRAIAAFGGEVELGRELATVYHPRLYAATIGALLPSVVLAARRRPQGLDRTVWFVSLMAILAGLSAIAAFCVLSPTRAVIVSLLSAATAVIWALCARALLRGQRWALAMARLVVLIGLLIAAGSLAAREPSLNLLGGIALLALWPAFGDELAEWVRPSAAIGRRLGLALVVIPVTAFGALSFPQSLPELTATRAADLHLDVTATCGLSGTSVSGFSVVATFSWDRLDPWPRGLQPSSPPTDWMSLWVDGTPAVGSVAIETLRATHRYFQVAQAGGGTPEDLTDPGSDSLSNGLAGEPLPTWYQPGSAVGYGLGPPIPVDGLRPGHRYRVTWSLSLDSGPVANSISGFVVTYDHLDQVGLQAVATCATPAAGARIDPPFLLP